MPSFRSIIAALALFAAAVNPLAAALMPCCCWGSGGSCDRCVGEELAAPTGGCCAERAAVRNGAACCSKRPTVAPACCAAVKPQPVKATSHVGSPAGNCDCEIATAPAMLVRDRELLGGDQYEPLLAISPLDKVDLPSLERGDIAIGAVPRTPTGPPLLALYCIWLK